MLPSEDTKETPRDRNIFHLRHLGKTFAHIAKLYNISTPRARQIYMRQVDRESDKRLKYVERRFKRSGLTKDIEAAERGVYRTWILGRPGGPIEGLPEWGLNNAY